MKYILYLYIINLYIMKNLLFILLSLSLFSCKKDVPPQTSQPVKIEEVISLWGEWKLLSGDMYMENMETGEKIKYSHFGPSRTISSLRYDGSLFDIDNIEQNVTLWSFYAPANNSTLGTFALNGNIVDLYGLSVIGNNWSIIENPDGKISHMGGSARPISATIDDYGKKIVKFRVGQMVTTINNYNWTYFSELRFQKIKEW
jgi:hypothetical protein